MPKGTYIRTKPVWNKGKKCKPLSIEHRKKLSLSLKGIKRKPFTEEHRKKLSISHKGCFPSEQTRKKLSIAHKGKIGYQRGKSGENTTNWRGGKRIHSNGYVWIYSPLHPYHSAQKYVLEHRLVMEKNLKRYLNPNEIVHHINGNHQDNRIDNLMLFSDSKSHLNYHRLILKKERNK